MGRVTHAILLLVGLTCGGLLFQAFQPEPNVGAVLSATYWQAIALAAYIFVTPKG